LMSRGGSAAWALGSEAAGIASEKAKTKRATSSARMGWPPARWNRSTMCAAGQSPNRGSGVPN